MSGFRITHSTARFPQMVVAADSTRPFPNPRRCPSCQTIHQTKTYHIAVDDTGAAIVSPSVLEGLKRAGAISPEAFSIESEVPNPPKQILGASHNGFSEIKRPSQITIYHQ